MAELITLLEGYGFGSDQGIVGFCGVYLVRSGGTTILFDTAHVGRRLVLLAALEMAGVRTADVDHVVMSHAHWDHVQNIDLFENADLMIHPDERRYAHRPHRNDWATPRWTGAAIETVRITEVGDGQQLAPGVKVVDVPGHSPGSIALAVETEQGLACLTGDALHFAQVALTKKNPLVFWNDDLATKSIERMVGMADVMYPGHDQPFRVAGDRVEYVHRFTIGISGVSPDGKTLREGATLLPPAPRVPWVMPGIEAQRLD
jgi:glyoxylase-like metal-dependent hydrolase (beta-lactamase superfamily II)